MKPANLASRWGLPTPIKNHIKRKIGRGHRLGELPKILEFPFNIFAMAEVSDVKIGRLVGFAKVQHKITRKRKVGVALG